MTTEIKAAIAGAIGDMERARLRFELLGVKITDMVNGVSCEAGAKDLEESIAALRRIEFVEVEKKHYSLSGDFNEFLECEGWNKFADHLTTTGHTIVKMGEPIELAEPYLNNGRGG